MQKSMIKNLKFMKRQHYAEYIYMAIIIILIFKIIKTVIAAQCFKHSDIHIHVLIFKGKKILLYE